jgi:hypothetical protein
MDTGTGIAIAGVWVMVAAAFYGDKVSSFGVLLSIVVATVITAFLK